MHNDKRCKDVEDYESAEMCCVVECMDPRFFKYLPTPNPTKEDLSYPWI